MSNEDKTNDSIPTRSQKAAQPAAKEAPAAKEKGGLPNLAGRWRVREGYKIAHGALDENGQHKHTSGGELADLTHEEAVSIIRLTKDQRNADGSPNGPAIETEKAYNARIEAAKAHREFLESIANVNGFPTGI